MARSKASSAGPQGSARKQQLAQQQHQQHQQQQHAHQQEAHKHGVDVRTPKEKDADWLMDRQIDIPLYTLLAVLVAHALSGTSSLSLPHLSTHLPHSIQTLLPGWARHLPILSPFATELPNASHDSKYSQPHSGGGAQYWATTGYAGPFRSDAVGFGHPLTALHNFTRACLGLSYEVHSEEPALSYASASYLSGDLRYGRSYFDRYPWNSWTGPSQPADRTFSFFGRQYEKGPRDAIFVLTGIFVFTVMRALVIRYALVPMGDFLLSRPTETSRQTATSRALAAKAARRHRRSVMRFAEQAWIAVWGTLSFTLSLSVAVREPYWTSELRLWADYPYNITSGLTKFYYLLQTAFWIQQVIVINVEAPRKDHWHMLTHHVVTILLLLGSYSAHFTPIGNVVLILMDPCDILLSTAKCLKYYGAQAACDVFFGLFMFGWVITRHVLYNRMLYSCIGVARRVLPEKPGATRHHYLGFRTFMPLALVGLLCVLQVILCLWLVMIMRVAWQVVTGKSATDSRSDESDDEDEAEIDANEKRAAAASSTASKPGANVEATAKRR